MASGRKIVINKCYGGFGLSSEALSWLWEKGYRDNASSIESYYSGRYTREDIVKDLKKDSELISYSSTFKYTAFSPDYDFVLSGHDIPRDLPLLVECVETLGGKASDRYSKLRIVEIPESVDWEVSEYDGMEAVEEAHRTWT